MISSLEELIQKRMRLIEAHEENDFTDGIHALLTDLYPDSAHFIYELLQNAEDMCASVVRFKLQKDGVWFQHNGTKRAFNLADIDAITNIGHNRQKKDDPTSIGKFGVGFKAVFAYTMTPEIHSGEYHFRIKDYFVPETEGVPLVKTQDADGTQWTVFWFPFNHQKKTSEKAYQETLTGLEQLNDYSILFLNHLKRIEYLLPDDTEGFAERIEEEQSYHVTIKYQKHSQDSIIHSAWLRFVEPIEMIDDQGNEKQMTISIAFALKKDDQLKETIVPIEGGGKTFIYFPAEKEHSRLRFHVSALFASTVARDSVRDCDENSELIQRIADLLKKSIGEIKDLGLLSNSFFECLPNNHDSLKPFYLEILAATRQAFAENEYLPAKEGGYVSTKEAVIGPKEISDLWKDHALHHLFGISKKWVSYAPQKNTTLDYFLNSLGIEELSYSEFVKNFIKLKPDDEQYKTDLVDYSERDKLEEYLQKQGKDWLKRFFHLCNSVRKHLDKNYWNNDAHVFLSFLKELSIVPDISGGFGKAEEMFIYPENQSLAVNCDSRFVEPEFINNDDELLSFFKKQLSIREYSESDVIRGKLNLLKIQPDEEYFKTMLEFAKYQEKHDDIDFSNEDLFITEDSENNRFFKTTLEDDNKRKQDYEAKQKTPDIAISMLGPRYYRPHLQASRINDRLYIAKANNIILGNCYGFSIGEKIVSIYQKYLLWKGYAEHYTVEELQLFINFAVNCGAMNALTIKQTSVHDHPDNSKLISLRGNETNKTIDIDYNIHHLIELLKLKSIEINLAIWNTLRYSNKMSDKYSKAKYQRNARSEMKEYESSLIYFLRSQSWIPDSQGCLHTPGSLNISEIHPDFVYDPNNALFLALQFGSDADIETKQLKKLEEDAAKHGKRIVDEDKYEEFLKFQEKQNKTLKFDDPHSIEELFEKESKKQTYDQNNDDDFSSDGSVGNKARRQQSIIDTFHESDNKPSPERSIFSHVSESNKEEKQNLYAWYRGKCQMCGTQIRKYNGENYFVARNVIQTNHLPDKIRKSTELGWNSLCLCPNCAAKYAHCSKSLTGLYEQILQTEVIEGESERIVVTIELDERTQEIRYAPKHFLALQTVVQLICDEADP